MHWKNRWYVILVPYVNENTFKIHISEAYETAVGFTEEVRARQDAICRARLGLGYGHFKLPGSVQILEHPIKSIEARCTMDEIIITGHFPIQEKTEFELTKTEVMPLK